MGYYIRVLGTSDPKIHISDDVKGEWNMAVKNFFGKWTNFTMDLGNQIQRTEFWSGNVPKNAKKL